VWRTGLGMSPRWKWAGWVVVCVLFVTGCGGELAPPKTPARGGPPWYEIVTAHFVIRTDMDEAKARWTAQEFERVYADLVAAAFPPDPRMARLPIIVLRDEREFLTYWPQKLGFYMDRLPGDIERDPMVVLAGAEYQMNDPYVLESLVHELTHRFVHFTFGPVPTWLDEGLASYFSTMRFEGDELFLGDVPRGYTVAAEIMPTVAQLRAADRATFYASGVRNPDERSRIVNLYYHAAWALVHFLSNGPDERRAQFRRFLVAMKQGDSAAAAWSRVFGATSEEELQAEFAAYQRATSWDRIVYRRHGGTTATIEGMHPLASVDIDLLWVRLFGGREDRRTLTDALIADAVALDPQSTDVAYVRGCIALVRDRPEEAIARFDEALANEPANPRFLFGVARSGVAVWRKTRDGKVLGRVIDVFRRLAATATTPDELAAAAEQLAVNHRPDDAIRLADRAVSLDPTSYIAHASRAVVHFYAGRAAAAVADQTRAIALVPESVDPKYLLAALARYRAALAKGTR